MSGLPNTIIVEQADHRSIIREALALEAFTPGHLIERAAGGVQLHSTSGGNSQHMFALENVADAGGIDRAYVATETSRRVYAERGQLINAFIAANADAISEGDALMSNGDGSLIVVTTPVATSNTDRVVAYAPADIDNSAVGSQTRFQIEVA